MSLAVARWLASLPPSPEALYALRDALLEHESAHARAEAARLLGQRGDERARAWLEESLGWDPRPLVRRRAALALARVGDERSVAPLRERLLRDPVWWVRTASAACLAALAQDPTEALLDGLADPFWRVRHACLRALRAAGDASPARREPALRSLEQRLLARDPEHHLAAARTWLCLAWDAPAPPAMLPEAPSPEAPPWLDADPAVTTLRLLRAPAGSLQGPHLLLQLAAAHGPLREAAARHLRARPEPSLLRHALALLCEPGPPHAADAARALLASLSPSQRRPLLLAALRGPSAHGPLAWAAEELLRARELALLPSLAAHASAEDDRVRALVLAARLRGEPSEPLALAALADPSARVRSVAQAWLLHKAPAALLERDPRGELFASAPAPVRRHLASLGAHLAQAARDEDGLTRAAAARHLAAPASPLAQDPDPRVRLALGLPVAPLPPLARREPEPLAPYAVAAERRTRSLPEVPFALSPLVLSGAGELSSRQLHRAREAGVNAWFWEPHHRSLSRFLRETRADRDARAVLAGTYHAHPHGIEADLRAALRRLALERVDLFLLFWARSPARLDGATFATLERLRALGLARAVGFSTHDRALALRALREHPWHAVMLRHSAAHPGAERELLPEALSRGVGVVGFSALAHGRMLHREGTAEPLSVSDCYRYCLSQPGLRVCLSAPRSARELEENLAVLARPTLEPEALARLRAHGALVHARDADFAQLVRRAPERRGPSLAALLEEESLSAPERPAANPTPLRAHAATPGAAR